MNCLIVFVILPLISAQEYIVSVKTKDDEYIPFAISSCEKLAKPFSINESIINISRNCPDFPVVYSLVNASYNIQRCNVSNDCPEMNNNTHVPTCYRSSRHLMCKKCGMCGDCNPIRDCKIIYTHNGTLQQIDDGPEIIPINNGFKILGRTLARKTINIMTKGEQHLVLNAFCRYDNDRFIVQKNPGINHKINGTYRSCLIARSIPSSYITFHICNSPNFNIINIEIFRSFIILETDIQF